MTERGDIFRSGALSTLIPPAPASADAQTSNQGGPLNIRHIRRGYGVSVLTGRTANKAITADVWTDVDYELAFTISTSERPLLIEARLTGASTNAMYVSFSIDGDVVGAKNGLCRLATAEEMLCPMWLSVPGAGRHRVSLVARVPSSESGTIYCVDDVAVIAAREV